MWPVQGRDGAKTICRGEISACVPCTARMKMDIGRVEVILTSTSRHDKGDVS